MPLPAIEGYEFGPYRMDNGERLLRRGDEVLSLPPKVALTLLVLVWHRAKRREGRPEIPYGVAIAFGGLAILAQRFLNHFA